MPYADNGGIRIHYEVEGTGPALVLQHGITQCVEDWFECGYVAIFCPIFRQHLTTGKGNTPPTSAAAWAADGRSAARRSCASPHR